MAAGSISSIIYEKVEEPCESIKDDKVIIAQTIQTSDLYQAITDQRLDDIKLILQGEKFINAPLFTSGSMAGYTILHVACMETNEDLVKMLIEEYHADVNIVADDGTQPIHLACLFENTDFVTVLLAAKADVEAEIERDIFFKYTKDKNWCDDFGEKITVLTYAVLFNNPLLAKILLNNQANARVKSHTSRTLLMYALKMNNHIIADIILQKIGDTEYINARDDNGYYTLYYLFHPKKYRDFRYDGEQLRSQYNIFAALLAGLTMKPNIYATVNGDPSTLLLNMVAYRSFANCLISLLPHYESLEMSKALYYATLQPEDPQKILHLPENYNEQTKQMLQAQLEENRKKTTELILKHLINRLSLRLPVPEEEKKLMDKLLTTDNNMRKLVNNYKCNFIDGELKNTVIHYGDKSMTYLNFLSQSDKKLQLLIRDENFMRSFKRTNFCCEIDHTYFCRLRCSRVHYARTRNILLEKLKTVQYLRKAIPLSYECVLEIVEYLKNQDLETFIDYFLKNDNNNNNNKNNIKYDRSNIFLFFL